MSSSCFSCAESFLNFSTESFASESDSPCARIAASTVVARIVGSAVLNGLPTAVLWTKQGEAKNLGVFGNDDASEALAINSDGLVVGYSSDQTVDAFRAVVFHDGQVTDLNSVVDSPGDFAQLTFANGVNSKGEIVGIGNLKSGGVRGYILTPIYSK